MKNSSRFFENRECQYYPCHKNMEAMNCLFCYCPLYEREHCPGKPEYIMSGEKKIKSCMNCSFPHKPENYDVIMQFLKKGPEKERTTDVAVMADIHNNHTALEACLSHAKKRGIQKFLFLGDYVSDCPYPQKTMQILYELSKTSDCIFIRGNREEYVLDYEKSCEKNWTAGSASGSLLYNYENLTRKDLQFFASLENHREVNYGACPTLTICHGSPSDTRELLFEEKENTKRILHNLKTDYLLCAHSHIQFVWEYEGKQIINPGSVGVPWYHDGRAQYAILRGNAKEWRTELIRLSYDVEQVMAEYEESGLNAMAPYWARMTRETIRTGVDKSSPVIKRVAKICGEQYTWPDYPEEIWEQAVKEVWPEMKEK